MQLEMNIEQLRGKKIFLATPMYGGVCHGAYTKALADADECIKIDGSWAKGYVRKGDCLDAMGGKYKEAYNAYNTALRYDQNNKSYEEKRDKILRKINNANSSELSINNDNYFI